MDIFFYSRHDDYGFFSNFSRTPVSIRGREYKTVEHWYQANKCEDQRDFERICALEKPGDAKVRGSIIRARGDWGKVKEYLMLEGLRAKFTQYPNLKKLLLDTGDSILHEDSPSDKYWGYAKGKGKDRLGILLMQVREELKCQSG